MSSTLLTEEKLDGGDARSCDCGISNPQRTGYISWGRGLTTSQS